MKCIVFLFKNDACLESGKNEVCLHFGQKNVTLYVCMLIHSGNKKKTRTENKKWMLVVIMAEMKERNKKKTTY